MFFSLTQNVRVNGNGMRGLPGECLLGDLKRRGMHKRAAPFPLLAARHIHLGDKMCFQLRNFAGSMHSGLRESHIWHHCSYLKYLDLSGKLTLTQ